MNGMNETAKARRGIQSIEVGGQLLNALVQSGMPMSLGELARQSGMPASKAHPYLVSFCTLGLVQQDPLSGQYQLGPFALQMGLVGLRQLSPVRLALPEITRLAGDIEQTVALAVWGTHGPTVIYIVESSRPIHINMHAGSVMSMLGTATGLVFSAFMPPKLVESMIARELRDPAVLAQAGSAPPKKALEQKLDEVRRHGMARAQQAPIPGINALSAPVFDHTGSLKLAVTATGPAGGFDTGYDGAIAQALRACTLRLSQALGYAGEPR